MPFKTLNEAVQYARQKAQATRSTWYVNRLASSGPMKYAVSRFAITDTSFGGGVVETIHPAEA